MDADEGADNNDDKSIVSPLRVGDTNAKRGHQLGIQIYFKLAKVSESRLNDTEDGTQRT